jgi:Domain of unknown function (DUF4126)
MPLSFAISPSELFALLAAIAFAAGLNVYLTLATLGLIARFGQVSLPHTLQLLQSWPVIAVAAALFAVEFYADKIPAFDLVWNALHTFIRVPIAAVLAYQATSQLSPPEHLLVAFAAALIAFAAHGGKNALRAIITPSPEPLSNITLSLGEDAFALAITWLATHHPYVAGAITLVLVVIIMALSGFVIRALRSLFVDAEKELADRT